MDAAARIVYAAPGSGAMLETYLRAYLVLNRQKEQLEPNTMSL